MATYKNGEKTKTIIYETAKKQFYENGYDNTTLTSISKESGANTAMVSYYFKSKLNLALDIYNEYMAAVKVITMHLLEKITDNRDIMFVTAAEIRIQTRNIQTSPGLARFLYELNNTNFYLKEQSATFGFFENINKHYNLGLDRDHLKSIAVTNYAISASLHAARYNGVIDCTNEFINRHVFTHSAQLMSFDDAFIQSVLDDSLDAFEKTRIWVGEGFRILYDEI